MPIMSDPEEVRPRTGDLPALEGEYSDIRREAAEVAGESWLNEPNMAFGWRTPEDVINSGFAYLVRNKLRILKYIGST